MENNQNQTKHRFGGAIPLLRKFQQHSFWTEKRKYSRAEAWIDLLFMARYGSETEEMWDRGEFIQIQYSQILTSMITLANRWKRNRQWVKNFINVLAKNGSISIITMNNRRTILQIVNMGTIKEMLQGNKQQSSQQQIHQTDNRPTYKNKDNKIENKVNNNNMLVERITSWAYERARIIPSCSKEAFKRSVVMAIEKSGKEAVYKTFEMEENAIQFLQNIKKL